jgi:hypothetical protein
MSLEDLGNIGEFVAAVAVVVSLIYLAVQIRQNTAQLVQNAEEFRMSFRQQEYGRIIDFNSVVIASRDVGDLLDRGRTDFDSLDGADRQRWNAYLHSLFRHYEGGYQFMVGGVQEKRVLALHYYLKAPSTRKFWRSVRETYEKSFREHVDSLVAEIEAGEDSREATEA